MASNRIRAWRVTGRAADAVRGSRSIEAWPDRSREPARSPGQRPCLAGRADPKPRRASSQPRLFNVIENLSVARLRGGHGPRGRGSGAVRQSRRVHTGLVPPGRTRGPNRSPGPGRGGRQARLSRLQPGSGAWICPLESCRSERKSCRSRVTADTLRGLTATTGKSNAGDGPRSERGTVRAAQEPPREGRLRVVRVAPDSAPRGCRNAAAAMSDPPRRRTSRWYHDPVRPLDERVVLFLPRGSTGIGGGDDRHDDTARSPEGLSTGRF